eukprot:SAG22_NODE_8339_length_663_cov_0.913121_2_plen_73_part_00
MQRLTAFRPLRNVIAGGDCTGSVTLNGEQVTERMTRQHSVICEQYDRHNAFLTVQETLAFAAKLYLTRSTGR